MHTFLLVIHIIVSLFLILVVLLQRGKGSEMGAAFGGSSQTLFGSYGSSGFLGKLTTAAATIFMITSLMLSSMSSKSSATSAIPDMPVSSQSSKTAPVSPLQQGEKTPENAPVQVPETK
ncbi:MAG: preprotein translocase subunit SecG [Candidatus Schekmanbacteria bacterium]|nr:preprotein translocase subunit SecG [Candidatus Schekmanbacteria bacterium]